MTQFSAWSFNRHSPTRMRCSALRQKFRHCCRHEYLENRIVLDATVVFNEIMYNPAGDETLEFVELYNENATNIDVSGWSIEGGINYTFPDPTVIDGRSYLVVAADPMALGISGGFSDALGPFSQGQLSNGGEELRLITHAGRRMSRVDYDDGGDWPVGADGSGVSLSRTSIHTNCELPESWSVSSQVGGTPGADNFPDPSLLPPVTFTYVDSGSSVRVRVPTSAGNLTWNSVDWNEPGFDDTAAGGWLDAAVGLGFDTSGSTSIADLLDAQGDIESQMYNQNATGLVRVPFNINDASALSRLDLTVDYNDGYVAYLNGSEIGRQNAPISLAFNSTATTTVGESDRDGDGGLINTYVGATSPLGNQAGGGPAVSNINVTAGPAPYLGSPTYDSFRLVDGTGFSSWSNKPSADQNWVDADGDGVPEIDSEVNHGMMSLMTNGGTQADQWISFDLGQSTSLDKMWIWGFNEIDRGSCPVGNCTLRGVSAARIWYSDVVSPTPATNPAEAEWTLLGNTTVPQGTGLDGFDDVAEVLFHGAQARHVLIDVESTHGLDQGNGDVFVGLSEVQFLSGSSSADTARDTIDLSAHMHQLVDGENLLAIHGLNSAVSDGTFFVQPKMTGVLRSQFVPETTYPTLIGTSADARVLVPSQQSDLTFNAFDWNDPEYDDLAAPGWFSANLAIGYDSGGGLVGSQLHVNGDIESQMLGQNSSALIRIPFEVTEKNELQALTFNLAYDDGAVVYLNGQEVVRENSPADVLAYDVSAASSSGATMINEYQAALPNGGGTTNITTLASFNGGADPGAAGADTTYGSDRLVDGNFAGFSPGQGDVGGELQPSGFYGHTTDPDPHMWFAGTSGFGRVTINEQFLGFSFTEGPQVVESMRIWNMNEITPPTGSNTTARGVRDMWIWYSSDEVIPAISPGAGAFNPGAGWTMFAGPGSGDKVTLSQGPAVGSYDGQTVDLGFDAKHVLFMIDSNYGDGNYVALSEVQFFGSSGFSSGQFDLTTDLPKLIDGQNVLAIHGLNESASDHDFLIKPTLSATRVSEPPPNLADALVINEVAPATDATFWLELANVGSGPINVAGVVVTAVGVAGGSHTLSSQTIPSGGTLQLTEDTLGFDAATGDKLFVYSSSQASLIDAREVTNRLRGRTAEGRWLYPDVATPDAANNFSFQSDVVINEIMFHHQASKGSDDGVVGEYASTTLVEIDALTPWRYNETGQQLGSNWAQLSHTVDSVNWFQGPAPLGFESSSLPEPIRTELTDPMLNEPFVNTHYFETDFTFSSDPADFVDLQLRYLIDDGAVFYLNGVELARYNMSGSVGSSVLAGDSASATIDNATFSSVTNVANELVNGTNRLSVEVHQPGTTSSDIVMAVELTAREEIVQAVAASGYHEINEEWFELYNRNAAQSVDLTGWSVTGGINFDFPVGTSIGPHDYLVVANDSATLRTEFPQMASKIIGDFSGRLSNKDDLILLRDASKNPADEVHYFDGGRWSQFADGGGSSLELRDPASDNARAEAWAASDETGKSVWQTYTMRHTAHADTGPNSGFNEYIVSLLNDGEVLIDDIHVIEDPDGLNRELIQNGTFESDSIGGGPSKWRIMENHHGTVIDDPDNPGNNKVLHLRATGRHDIVSNLAETTLKAGNSFVTIRNGREYEISLRAKWITGCSRLNSRFFVSRVMRTDLLTVPLDNGTPGAQNSTFTANAGPTYSEFSHSPIIPAAGESITVSTVVDDSDTIASMTLFWNVNGGSFTSAAMNHQGDGKYSGIIPGRSSSSKIQFYVQGQDALGAVSTFPDKGRDSRAMIRVQDGQRTTTPIDTVRIIMTTAETDALFDTTKIKSDELRGATVVHNDREVFYDVGVRLIGSVHGRHNPQRQGSYKIQFHPDQPFRGVLETIGFDGSGNSALLSGHGHDEILTKTLINRAGGALASQYDDVGYLIAPKSQHTSAVMMELARYNNPFLEETYGSSDGTLFELEAINWVPNTTGGREGFKNASPLFSTAIVANTDISNLGDDKENYRWNFLIKNNRNRDDYSRIIEMAKAFDLTGSALDNAMEELIDMDAWLRTLAMNALIGEGDFYTMGAQFAHNMMMYVRPSDGKVVAMPWDNDHGYGNTSGGLIGSNQWNLTKIAKRPQNLRRYYGHMLDLIDRSFNRTYAAPWATHLGSLTGESYPHANWFGSRANFVTNQIKNSAPQVSFAVTSSDPLHVGSNNMATITGKGWVNVEQVRLTSSDQPLELTWSAGGGASYANTWQTTIPVASNTSTVILEAYDFQGNVIGTDSIVINSTATNDVVGSLRISEINYHPVDPTPSELGAGFTDDDDFEFIELQNIGSQPVALGGVSFTEGVAYAFPSTTSALAGGDRMLVVRNQAAFELRYGTGINIAGEYSGRLSNNGERIRLETSTAETILDFSYGDSDPWYERTDGVGGTLVVNDVAATPVEQFEKYYHWRGSTEFGGSPAAASADPVGIVINEVFTQTDPPVAESDSIELYNPTGTPISITGWYLSDSGGDLLKYQLSAMSLPAGGYFVLDESDFNPTPGVDPSFALSGTHGDDVWLTISDGIGGILSFVDDVHFSAAPNGESFARVPDGTGRLAPMQSTTLGMANDEARVGSLIISELNYNPGNPSAAALSYDSTITADDLEFVEIYNSAAVPVDLAQWRIRGAVDYEFGAGTILGAEDVLVVTSFNPADPGNANRLAAFRVQYGMDVSVPLVGGYQGQLNDSFERVELQRPGNVPLDEPAVTPRLQEDEVLYDDLIPWPVTADGVGNTLHRTHSTGWGNNASSWTGGPPGPGKMDLPGDTDLDGDVDTGDLTTAIINFTSAGGTGRVWSEGDFDGDGDVDTGDLTTAIINFTSARNGRASLASAVAVSSIPTPLSENEAELDQASEIDPVVPDEEQSSTLPENSRASYQLILSPAPDSSNQVNGSREELAKRDEYCENLDALFGQIGN